MKKGIISLLSLSVLIGLSGCNSDSGSESIDYGKKATGYLVDIADEIEGIGAREASTPEEEAMGNWLYDKLTGFGYDVEVQPFTYQKGDKLLSSKNFIVEKQGASEKTIVLAAHYDSTGSDHGSLGATDNGAGVAAAVAIAESLMQESLPYTVRILFPGAEENGLNGSLHYVRQALDNDQLDNVIAMINYDTVGGGDYVYVHAAHSDYAEYQSTCEKLGLGEADYNAQPHVRDAMLQASIAVKGEEGQYTVHPAFPGYPEGETGSWSDHAGFACAGIPIAYVEATNFDINGKWGFDGYSQTVNPAAWDCYDAENKTACDRENETRWGKIWHTEFDRLDKLEELFPGRVEQQLSDNVNIVLELMTSAGYISDK
ncbi:Zn-dependent exopeptidase M28 [Photobacterium gaetbulicola]|uniref:M28 family peptidase n=1 Tax=Photobacterium gaetbulicola Gung47 TaxID=658445 RepID=A0A0C5W1E8_9GAMM|nr:M20/M25/M40 family metallo-hydrolase [Photobacterium gaetbulicola]AJR05156.1 M28 family peptidase [Photobacterium gaetbulicola Gung47]PSU06820.1 Zn-dependent exopeptidase M28 [Photobacterium gaetbulicola]